MLYIEIWKFTGDRKLITYSCCEIWSKNRLYIFACKLVCTFSGSNRPLTEKCVMVKILFLRLKPESNVIVGSSIVLNPHHYDCSGSRS